MSIGPINPTVVTGRAGRRPSSAPVQHSFRAVASRRLAAFALALLASTLVVTPALSAADLPPAAGEQLVRQSGPITAPGIVAPQDSRDAFDGGYVPPVRQLVIPSIEVGLTPQRPIPVGVTCSCTIDRVGLVSQFDITVIEVVQDARAMVQQLNRFNRPPRSGARYLAAYVGQQYIAGPDNQAYSSAESDWKSTGTDGRLSDTAQLLHTEIEFRPRADIFPRNYVNGWLIYELPVNRPAYLVWNYNFVGERGIWFALQ